jgi:hypothetical protein
VAQTVGSDSAQRTYVSVDSGEHRGFKMYLSGVYADTDKWKGEGPQRQWQFNGKAVYDWSDWRFTGWAATSRRATSTAPSPPGPEGLIHALRLRFGQYRRHGPGRARGTDLGQ